MPRPTRTLSAPTDRQRLLISRELPSSTIPDHRQHFALPSKPKGPPAPAGTLAIYGKDGTYICLDFGAGRMAGTIHLSNYMAPYKVPLLSNHMVNLVGYLPDTIGLDIGLAASASADTPFFNLGASGLGGINFIWHTRGDSHAGWPEVHLYYGYSGNAGRGSMDKHISLLDAAKSAPAASASGAAQLILGWARYVDKFGNSGPADSEWVGNGYNWTGKFYSIGFVQPVYGAWSAACSYFTSLRPFSKIEGTTYFWRGITIGVGVAANLGPKKLPGVKTQPVIKPDIVNIFKNFNINKFKDLGISYSVTNYSLVYGNGGDFIPASADLGLPRRDIGGGHFPGINQDHDK